MNTELIVGKTNQNVKRKKLSDIQESKNSWLRKTLPQYFLSLIF